MLILFLFNICLGIIILAATAYCLTWLYKEIRRMLKETQDKGFTVIELLVTIAILTILGAVIIVSIQAGLDKRQPKGEITPTAWSDTINQ